MNGFVMDSRIAGMTAMSQRAVVQSGNRVVGATNVFPNRGNAWEARNHHLDAPLETTARLLATSKFAVGIFVVVLPT